MIKIYGMDTCPDCTFIKEQIINRQDEFTYIDIGSSVKLLKEFIKLRDNSSLFDECKKNGSLGIPCFVDGDKISLDPRDFSLIPNDRSSCSLEDHKLGKKGC